MTSRLDTIQAAVLIEKLKIFADEIAARNEVARRYAEGLNDVAVVPAVPRRPARRCGRNTRSGSSRMRATVLPPR